MLRSTRNVMSLILACVAIVGIASPASAIVEAGIVGPSIHKQYGPQDAGGNYLGIASESYDFYSDALWGNTGWGDNFPTWSGSQRPPDGVGYGYVLLAFNPYTGEVWNDIPATHQALNPAGTYSGHAPSVGLTGVDGGGNPISSAVVTEDLGRGYTENTVYITGEFIPRPDDGVSVEPFGSFVNTSADGGILSADPWVTYNTSWGALLPHGAEVKDYAAGAPDRPVGMYQDTGTDLDFDHNKTWGFSGFWNWGWGYYAGDQGGAADNLFGFEMDGKKGWMRLDFSGNHSGVRLTEYYFDIGDFDGDAAIGALDIDLLADAIRLGSADLLFDVNGDGNIDVLDLDKLVRELVETTVGNGTEYGDFNLDGLVDITDLTRLATSYGFGTTWAQGNANRNFDLLTDTTDLTILATYYGFDASVDVIPEPMTLSLLALGSAALLRKSRARK